MIKKIIPHTLKKTLQSTEIYSIIDSKRLASSSKRLDICAAQFAHLLHSAKMSGLQGKVCLEIGSGWVLSHALICYLLGAKKVIATDIAPNAYPSNLQNSVNKSVISLIRDILSPFESHEKLRERLNALIKIKKFDFNVLQELGITYIAPINMANTPINDKLDFVFSFSVLEHIPVKDVRPLLQNLHSHLNSEGTQAHCIHLEDHKDIPGNPYEFLSIPESDYDQLMQTDRGNRLRCNQWMNYFSSLAGSETRLLYKWSRDDRSLPDNIDSSIVYENIEDLRVTHMGVMSKRV